MTAVVRFENAEGHAILVETTDDAYGMEQVSHGDGVVVEAAQRIEDVLAGVRPAIRSLVRMLEEFAPQTHEVEFGIKLNAEAGVIVAKTAAEGHFTVKLTWQRDDR
jgi:hypothetical protein